MFHQLLQQKKIILLDGATGTQLQAHGMPRGEVPELFLLSRPEVITQVHRDYVSAGADAVLTCTFGANRLKLRKVGKEDQVDKINRSGVQLARRAAEEKTCVLGDVGPTGEMLVPYGTVQPEEVSEVFSEQIKSLGPSTLKQAA